MLPVHIDEKLQLFDNTKYKFLNSFEEIQLVEKSKSGKVNLQCKVNKDSLIILSPEKNVLPYLNSESGSRCCADIFIYSKSEEENEWDLHIIEFKKTINTTSISKSKWQFTMGIYNARAISAFVGFNIRDIYLYSGFRTDAITTIDPHSLIYLRASNNPDALKLIREWKKGYCDLDVDHNKMRYKYSKIKLDNNGDGNVEI